MTDKDNPAMTTLSPKLISFNFSTMKFEGLTMSQVEIWERLYPDLSIKDELVDMIRWLDKVKGTKKARKSNWQRFICNWLRAAQQRSVIGG
jgi:hypothetical protein